MFGNLRCTLDADEPHTVCFHEPVSLHPELRSDAGERQASIWLPGVITVPRPPPHPSCKLRKPAAAASKTWEQAQVPEPTIRRHPRCREVLETSRVITGGKEYSWQAPPDAEKQNKKKFQKLSKLSRSTSEPHKTKDANSRVLADQGVEDKGLGDLSLKASLSLQKIHLTDGILQGRSFCPTLHSQNTRSIKSPHVNGTCYC